MLDEAVYRSIRLDLGFRAASPVVEGYAVAEGQEGRVFQVLGVDPLAEAPFRPYVGGGSGVDLAAFMARPRSVLMVAATAAGLGLEMGDTLSVAVAGQLGCS
jgi:putative ABC transport system permease protein